MSLLILCANGIEGLDPITSMLSYRMQFCVLMEKSFPKSYLNNFWHGRFYQSLKLKYAFSWTEHFQKLRSVDLKYIYLEGGVSVSNFDSV